MFEHCDGEKPKQEEFWVEKRQLPAVKAGTFYRKLDETLREMEFAGKVRDLCRAAYKKASSGGRPGIDPSVYFKMLMIGGFVEELEPIIEKVGAENIVIVQLTREGCDYSSDSRKYFNGRLINEWTVGSKTAIDKAYVLKEEMNIKTYRVHNNGSLHNLHDALDQILRYFGIFTS